jgi:hypothetical protein
VARPAYPHYDADDIPRALPINEAAREWARITGTRRPHRSTLIRWCTRGCRGVRLAGRLAGGGWFVTCEALREFHVRVNERPLIDDRTVEANPARAAEIATALVELDSLIGRPPRTVAMKS